jgi:hypothetical protein
MRFYTRSFTKSGGGTIGATNSAPNGKVVYVRIDESSGKKRNSVAGASVYMDSRVSGNIGG